MDDLIIVGAGGFGREVYAWINHDLSKAHSKSYRIKGFLDDDPTRLQGFALDSMILASIERYEVEQTDRFVIGIGTIESKKRIVESLEKRSAQFISIVHSTAVVAPTATIGKGVVVCPFVTISDNANLGDYSMLNYYSSCGHDSRLGKYSILSPYAAVNGFSVVEEEVFMGTHATVAPHKRVGHGSKISANAAAMNHVPPFSLVYGVPGKMRVMFGE